MTPQINLIWKRVAKSDYYLWQGGVSFMTVFLFACWQDYTITDGWIFMTKQKMGLGPIPLNIESDLDHCQGTQWCSC